MGAWGKDAHGGIPRCFWPKSYNPGGVLSSSSFLLQKWSLDARGSGRNEYYMGIRGPKMTILRPSYHGDWERNFCDFGGQHTMGERTGSDGREAERKREGSREIPEFPKPPRARAAVW